MQVGAAFGPSLTVTAVLTSEARLTVCGYLESEVGRLITANWKLGTGDSRQRRVTACADGSTAARVSGLSAMLPEFREFLLIQAGTL